MKYLGHHTTPNVTNMYKILQSGYLKPGAETGKARLYGKQNGLSKYIYLKFFDITGGIPHFELDVDLLLDNFSYLNYGWAANPEDYDRNIDGHNINKTEMLKIIKNYRNKLKENRSPYFDHEILLTENIDLVKYLRRVTLSKRYMEYDTFDKLIRLLERKYPNVEVRIL